MSDSKGLLLNNFKKKDEINEEEKIIEVITKILKAIHLKKYEEIMDCVDKSEVDDLSDLFECVEKSLEYNGFGSIDEYGAACNFRPQYEYCMPFYNIFNCGKNRYVVTKPFGKICQGHKQNFFDKFISFLFLS